MTQSHFVCLGLLCWAAPGCSTESPAAAEDGWTVQTVDTLPRVRRWEFPDRVIHFSNGRQLTVVLTDLEVLGQLPSGDSAPVLVLAGRECEACDAGLGVYFVRADGDSIDPRDRPFSFPGTHEAAAEETSEPYWRGRLFLGKCATQEVAALWLQSVRDSTGQWHDSAFQVRVLEDSIAGGLLSSVPPLATIEENVRSGACVEIPGRLQYMM